MESLKYVITSYFSCKNFNYNSADWRRIQINFIVFETIQSLNTYC